VTPALFIVVAIAFVVAVLDDERAQLNARKGLVIVLAGLPYYWLWNAWRRRRT
jgi:hypothetical protein